MIKKNKKIKVFNVIKQKQMMNLYNGLINKWKKDKN